MNDKQEPIQQTQNDEDCYHLETLSQSFDKRKPFFEEKWVQKVEPLLDAKPQVTDDKVNYLLCGSTVYLALALSQKTEEIIDDTDEQPIRKTVDVSPLTRAGLLVPLLIPGDVDIVSLQGNEVLPGFDPGLRKTDLFWKLMKDGMRRMVHNLNGKEVYTIHPVDNFVFRLIAHAMPLVADHALDKIPKKLDQILRSLKETWPEDEIRQRAIEAIKVINKVNRMTDEQIMNDPFWNKFISNPTLTDVASKTTEQSSRYQFTLADFSSQKYSPLILARKNGLLITLPTLSNFLDSLQTIK